MPWSEKSRTQSDAAPGRACETKKDIFALEREVEACPEKKTEPLSGQFWYKKRDGA